MDIPPPKQFRQDASDKTGEGWRIWKQQFQIYMAARDLEAAPGRRKVNMLLHLLGQDSIKLFNTFVFAPAQAAEGDNLAVAAENPDDLDAVLLKFDTHYGHKKYRSIKRQAFFDRKQKENEPIMSFVADIKMKAKECEYGAAEESVLVDKIINGVKDRHIKIRLLDLEDEDLTLDNVIRVCRSSELTQEHVELLEKEQTATVNFVRRGRSRARGYSGYRGGRWKREQCGNECEKCRRSHPRGECPAFNKHCGACGEKGHYSRSTLCRVTKEKTRGYQGHMRYSERGRSRGRGRGHNVHRTDYQDSASSYEQAYNDYGSDEYYSTHDNNVDEMGEMFEQCNVYDVFKCATNVSTKDDDWFVDLNVHGKQLSLELDTGARCNILSLKTLKRLQFDNKIEKSNVLISGVHSNAVKAVGKVTLSCEYKGTKKRVEFQVLNDEKQVDLLGRAECVGFGLIARVHKVTNQISEALLCKFRDVFEEKVGCVPGEVEIRLDPNVNPVITAPRPVPAAIREQVKKELEHLEKCNIIKKVTEPTEWVNPLICVKKPNGRVRLCIDPFKLNQAIKREHYPMSSVDDIATRLQGSKYFSVLDANMGYYQVKLTDKSSHCTTFNTPFGRYRHLRLPMGISSAPEIFQRVMKDIFENFEGVEITMDDILIHGKTMQQHNQRLEAVLRRARECQLKLNAKKTVIAQTEVQYTGHMLTGEGLKPTPDRVKAIVDLKEPENLSELESVLGMIAYVAKFIPNLSEVNAPLRALKTKDVWEWTSEHSHAFQQIKTLLSTAPCLKYFDVNAPVLLSVDASSKGLGAAIMQKDGIVAYASRALTPTEQKYAQIEKEMLAVVFGCIRFHKMIYGMSDVTIQNDHKPLETLLKKPIHNAPMRIQRMMLKLQPYTFNLVYIRGKTIGLADCLSRLSLEADPKENELMDNELMVCRVDTLAGTNHDEIEKATKEDSELQKLKSLIREGWPETRSELPLGMSQYWDLKDEFSSYNGIVFRGDRVCIPKSLRPKMLKMVHKSHMGIVKTKQLARDIIFWPGMAKQIEDTVSRCSICLETQKKNPKEPMQAHPVPDRMWSKVGSDLFVWQNVNYLIMVDYYSGFIEVDKLQDTRAETVIEKMKGNIARHGIMDLLVTDGGPQYTCMEFERFEQLYGFKHNISSPGHQQANGLAENAVKQIKHLLKKTQMEGGDFYLGLLDLRNTPRDDMTGSPVQRLMSRRTKTNLPTSTGLLKPQVRNSALVRNQLVDYREKQKYYYDQKTQLLPDIQPGDAVRMLTPKGWIPAQYEKQHQMPRSHIIKAGDHARSYRRNRKMLMRTNEDPHVIEPMIRSYNLPRPPVARIQEKPRLAPPQPRQIPDKITPNLQMSPPKVPIIPTKPPSTEQIVRSRVGREIRKSQWLREYKS
jgi:transposase InsO family protein